VGIFGTNALTLGASGLVLTNTTANLILGTPVTLGQAQTWSVVSGATLTLTNKLSGTGNPVLTLTGGGAFNFNNNISGSGYGGQIIINSGTLSLPYGWNTPSVTGNVTVGTNATLVFNSHPYSYGTDNYTTNAGNIAVNGDNQFSNLELRGGQISGTGDLRVGDIWGYSTGGHWASRSNSITATVNVAYLSLYNTSVTLTVENGGADPDLLISSPIQDGGNGAASLTKTGTGKLALTKPCTYTGNTTNLQGSLDLSSSDNILPAATALYLATNTVLNLNGINQTVAHLAGFGTVNLGSGSFTDQEAGTNTFGGVFTGAPNGAVATDYQTAPPGGIALTGSGRLVFTNLQTYTGDTWISAGTLALTGAGALTGSSNIIVSAGATLDASGRTDGTLRLALGQTLSGFGTVLGKVLVTNGATLSPGSATSPGTLALNSLLNLTGGRTVMNVAKNSGVTVNDAVTGITTLTLGGTLTVTNTGTDTLAVGDSFKLFTAGTYTGAFTNYNLPPLGAGLAWNTAPLVTNGTLAVVSVAPPILSRASLTGENVKLSFSGTSGQSYRVLFSTNLTLAVTNWTVLTNGTFGAGSVAYTNGPATNRTVFYRIASP
jgi:fibronectin-binding autotransporter adhesin